MKHILLLTFLLAFVGSAVAENEIPVVRTVDPEIQPKIQFLNPQYLVYLPTGDASAQRCGPAWPNSHGITGNSCSHPTPAKAG